MYERFHVTAITAMQNANKAAQNANHEFICSEDILIGLTCSWDNFACEVLTQLLVTPDAINKAIEKYVQPFSGQCEIAVSKYSEVTTNIIELADRKSKSMGDPYTGPEHLLLGVLLSGQGLACAVLNRLGVTHGNVEATINSLRLRLEWSVLRPELDELVAHFELPPGDYHGAIKAANAHIGGV